MNISFWGSSNFSLEILKALFLQHQKGLLNLQYVVSQPAKPVGRKRIITHNLVAQFALDNGIVLYTPNKLKDLFGEASKESNPELYTDISFVAAYGKILTQKVLSTAQYGFVNFHGSLLPEYRGAIPVQKAILNQDKQTGVTVIKMDEGMDTGDIITIYPYAIPTNMTGGELMHELALISANAVIDDAEVLFKPQNWNLTIQDHEQATLCYVSDFVKPLLEVTDQDSVIQAHGKIMAANPEPKAWCKFTINGQEYMYNLIRSNYSKEPQQLTNENAASSFGLYVDKITSKLYLKCKDGLLEIAEIQPAGKPVMNAKQFINGNQKILNYLLL